MSSPWRWQEEYSPFPVYALVGGLGPRAAAVVTTRKGGFSEGPFESLNLSLGVGDNASDVERNRALVDKVLALDEGSRASPEQVHGSLVVRASSPGTHEGADGLVCSSGKIWLSVLVADCVPVVVFDPRLSAVGIAHAGRAGTVAQITSNLIELFKSSFQLDVSELVVALGPSVGPCCYELDQRSASGFPCECVVERRGRLFLDLWKANTLQAVKSGIREENVTRPPACTSCRSELFFSHRAHRGTTGRQAAITRAGGLRMRRL